MNRSLTATLLGLAIISLAIPMLAQGQPCRLMGGPQAEKANVIVRSVTPTDGYVLAGWTKSFGPGTPNASNALIVRTDSRGAPLNAVVTTGIRDDEATSMIKTSDGDYVVTGWTRSYNPGTTNMDIFVLKLHGDLSFHWGKVYHLSSGDYDHAATSIIGLSAAMGGGYALTGYASTTGSNHKILVMKLDASGNVVWLATYSYPNDRWDEGYGITEVSDATAPTVKLAVVGYATVDPTSGIGDAFVLRLTSNGGIVGSTSVMAGNYDEQARSVVWDGSGTTPGIVAAGWTKSYGAGIPHNANVWVAKIRAGNGAAIWSNVYNWAAGLVENDDRVLGDKSLIVTSGNCGTGYAVSGRTYSQGPGTPNAPNFLTIKVNYNGTLGWGGLATVHPSTNVNNNSDEAYAMLQVSGIPNLPVPGDGYAIAGWTNSFAPPAATLGLENFHFATLDQSGTRPAGCALRYAMVSATVAWTARTISSGTLTPTVVAMSITTCLPSSQAVCGGTFFGFEPRNNELAAPEGEPSGSQLGVSPNPFRGATTVSYVLPARSKISLRLYSVTGNLVRTLIDDCAVTGEHSVRLDASRLVSGIYLLKLVTRDCVTTEKLIIE
jgi:hypothetical protein